MINSFITENGFAIVGVFDAEPPFAYTIGMTAFNRPELIIVGNFDAKTFNNVLIEIGHRYLKATGVKFVRKDVDTVDATESTMNTLAAENTVNTPTYAVLTSAEYESLPVMIEIAINNAPVSVPVGLRMIRKEFHEMLLCQELNRYGDIVQCIQLIIPDSNGKLPWDTGFDTHWNYHAMQIPLYEPPVESCDNACNDCGCTNYHNTRSANTHSANTHDSDNE
jgi:hypothetical protein